MYIQNIIEAVVPVLNSFPKKHGTLSFDKDTLFLEGYGFDLSEILEFEHFNVEPTTDNLLAVMGYITIQNAGEEFDIYAVYGYDDKVYFVTIVFPDNSKCTYDFTNSTWSKWTEN